jgi:hypothetical protein
LFQRGRAAIKGHKSAEFGRLLKMDLRTDSLPPIVLIAYSSITEAMKRLGAQEYSSL